MNASETHWLIAKELSDDNLRRTVLTMRSEFGFFALSFREVLDDSGRSAELPPESSRWTRVSDSSGDKLRCIIWAYQGSR